MDSIPGDWYRGDMIDADVGTWGYQMEHESIVLATPESLEVILPS